MSNNNYNYDVEYIKSLIESQDLPTWKSGIKFLGCNNPFSKTIYSCKNAMKLCHYVKQNDDGSFELGRDNLDEIASTDLRFASFNQIVHNNLKLRKGAKSREVEFYADSKKFNFKLTKDHPSFPSKVLTLTADELAFFNTHGYVELPCLKPKTFKVFHFSDIENIDTLMPITLLSTEIDQLMINSGAKIFHKLRETGAYYPSQHVIKMPLLTQWQDMESYYATLLHEFAHWTSHDNILGRYKETQVRGIFGDVLYAREELVAELSAISLSDFFGLNLENCISNHDSYLKSWGKLLNDDDIRWAIDKSQEIIKYVNKLMKPVDVASAA